MDNLEDDAEERGQEYEDARSNRGAAGWLVFLAVAAIVFHGVMIFIRTLYLSSTIENYFSGYAFIVSVHTYMLVLYVLHMHKLYYGVYNDNYA